MSDFRYQEEDIDFPPVKYSEDLKYTGHINNSCCKKFKKFIRVNLKCLIITIIILIIFIVTIIMAVKMNNQFNLESNNHEFVGGYLIFNLSNINDNEKKIDVFSFEKIGIQRNDLIANKVNNNDENMNIVIENNTIKYNYKIGNISDIDTISFIIAFKKPITSMNEMFKDNIYLNYVNLSNLITSEIKDLNSAFLNCINLKSIDFGNFNANKIESMDNTFENCSSLKAIDLSSFKVPYLKTLINTFKNCISLEYLRMDNFIFNSNVKASGIFDSINDKILLIIKEEESINYLNNSYSFISFLRNYDECTSYIENCQTCNSNYLCEACKENYTISSSKLQCIKDNNL